MKLGYMLVEQQLQELMPSRHEFGVRYRVETQRGELGSPLALGALNAYLLPCGVRLTGTQVLSG